MFYQTESKLQGWRALAILDDNTQCLLYVGRSTTQIRTGYAAAFLEVLDNEQRARVRSISMQCWQGAADRGRWIAKAVLSIPCSKPAAAQSLVTETDLDLQFAASGVVDDVAAASRPSQAVLPFRRPKETRRSPGWSSALVLPFRQPLTSDDPAEVAPAQEESLPA